MQAESTVSRPDRSFRVELPWVLFLTLVVFVGILPRLLLSPLLLRIAASFSVDFGTASGLFVTGSAGFVVGLVSSGFIANRLRHRATIVLALVVNGVALVGLSLARSLLAFHAIFALANWASGLYPGSGIASVTSLVTPSRRGVALAIHESGPNLAFLVAPILVALLAPFLGWRGVYRIAGAAALLVSIAFATAGRASHDRGQPLDFTSMSKFLGNRRFWVISLFFAVAGSGAMGVFAVLPTYLIVDHDLSEQVVNTLVGLSRLSGFASILLAGTLVDRFGFAPVVGVVLGTTGLVTVGIGLGSGPLLVAAVFLQPLTVGAFFPVGLAALSDSVDVEARSLAVALAIPLANIVGAGVMPRVLSAVGAAGHFRVGFLALGIVTILSLVLLRGLRHDHAVA